MSLSEEVSIKKAAFRKSEFLEDGVLNVEVYNIKSNCLIKREKYKNGYPTGICKSYSENCSKLIVRDFSEIKYENPDADKAKSTTKDTSSNLKDSLNNPLTIVDEMPKFEGGEEALFKFLGKNIQYPQEAKDMKASGIVYISFIINEKGGIETYYIARGLNPYLDYEAWQVVKKMPDWKPGIQKGLPVRVKYNLPIRFTLR